MIQEFLSKFGGISSKMALYSTYKDQTQNKNDAEEDQSMGNPDDSQQEGEDEEYEQEQ